MPLGNGLSPSRGQVKKNHKNAEEIALQCWTPGGGSFETCPRETGKHVRFLWETLVRFQRSPFSSKLLLIPVLKKLYVLCNAKITPVKDTWMGYTGEKSFCYPSSIALSVLYLFRVHYHAVNMWNIISADANEAINPKGQEFLAAKCREKRHVLGHLTKWMISLFSESDTGLAQRHHTGKNWSRADFHRINFHWSSLWSVWRNYTAN